MRLDAEAAMRRGFEMSGVVVVGLLGGMIGLLAGCNSKTKATPENFTKVIDAYYLEHSDCLIEDGTHFPFETTDKEKTKQMDSLVKMQMLTKAEEMSIHASRYTVTEAGARAAPKFCYGHRVVTAVDGFTPPALKDGFQETAVTYHYSMEDVPVWAKSAEVMAAFPKMAEKVGGKGVGKTTLAKSAVGWSVPD